MPIPELTAYLTAAKAALDLFKGIRAELPDNSKSDEIKGQIDRAEYALRVSEAELAKAFGFNLCDCSLPPHPMLWKEAEQAHICSNPECGRKKIKSGGTVMLMRA